MAEPIDTAGIRARLAAARPWKPSERVCTNTREDVAVMAHAYEDLTALLALLEAERLARQTAERERDEARAMAPRWVPSSLNMWHLQVGTATFGRIWPTGRYWSAKTAGCASERVDTQEDAARAVCARLGLPYIEVPRE